MTVGSAKLAEEKRTNRPGETVSFVESAGIVRKEPAKTYYKYISARTIAKMGA